jgi:hypothetical protein
MSITANAISRRRILSSFLAALTTITGLASSSCASPRLPTGGYPLRSSAAGYELQVLLDGSPAPTYDHGGETYVLGQLGSRYTLRIVNHTGRRIEAVVSVDGRDAIDGKSADVRNKRGYMVPGWGSVDIDGWRLSRAEVAAFRFSSVSDSYAARTGNAREVGAIGVAVFPERYVPPQRPLYAPPRYPNQPSPRWPDWRDDARGQGASPPSDSYGRAEEREGSASGSMLNRKSSSAGADAAPPASAAPSPSGARSEAQADVGPARRSRSGLGTEFGEAVNSPVQEVSFARANATHPAVILGARYNDRDGLLALGINVDGCCTGDDDLAWRQSATPFPGSDHRYAAPPSGWHQGCCVGY